MTERAWLECVQPLPMLTFLRANSQDRKLRLFICACCRRFWKHLTAERSRQAVEWAERFIEGTADETVRHAIIVAAWQVVECDYKWGRAPVQAWWAAYAPCDRIMERDEHWNGGRHWQRVVICDLLREIVGNPFRAVSIEFAWLTPTVRSLATAAYEERALPSGELDSSRLAVLADALEETGCTDAEILGHLRSGGIHVRGCWCVDLCLGKK